MTRGETRPPINPGSWTLGINVEVHLNAHILSIPTETIQFCLYFPYNIGMFKRTLDFLDILGLFEAQ